MNFGIKQKILIVLVGVLALTTSLNALLASYYTNRQNQESAFTALNRDLLAWQNDLQALTLRLKNAALSAGKDTVLLNQLAEVLTLEFVADGAGSQKNLLEEITGTLSCTRKKLFRSGWYAPPTTWLTPKLVVSDPYMLPVA